MKDPVIKNTFTANWRWQHVENPIFGGDVIQAAPNAALLKLYCCASLMTWGKVSKRAWDPEVAHLKKCINGMLYDGEADFETKNPQGENVPIKLCVKELLRQC